MIHSRTAVDGDQPGHRRPSRLRVDVYRRREPGLFRGHRSESLAEYNRELANRGLPALSIGIGLHRGNGVAGLVDSQQLKGVTFFGRTVNVAARVQDLTPQFAVDIILTETPKQTIAPRFSTHALPDTPVKGVEKPLAIHALD